ncbi:MAG: RNA polymerase factor sigma-54 [Prevotella sp.]|nr:RNA polymerase factor sigma-54 [Prevotella sp.]
MPQTLNQEQIQEQKLVAQQHITGQQLLNVRLLGMSAAELEQSINAELDDNPALEKALDEEPADGFDDARDDNYDDDYEGEAEREERQDELNRALESMESDDEPPEKDSIYNREDSGTGGFAYAATPSFRDRLTEQMGESELTDKEKKIMEYLIGSLDSDGFLRKDTDVLADELVIYEYVDTDKDEVERVLRKLQEFDPPGLGARSLQECLRLQIERMEEGRLKTCMLAVTDKYFAAFTRMRWDKIKEGLSLNDVQIDTLKQAFRRLNPKPGAALGESIGRSTQQITPDFTVYPPDENGHIAFDINTRNIPSLVVSDTFSDMLDRYKKQSDKPLGKPYKEAMLYVRNKVERANWFIEALRSRQRTMKAVMSAIISRQHKYFVTGEESDLRPMILKDIGSATGLDLSTVSRVSNEKYASTQWGIFPLRHFFTDSFASQDGGELSTRAVRAALRDVIDKEDKRSPLSDEALVEEMRKRGYNIARRTIAKYRDKMGIPVSKLRADR